MDASRDGISKLMLAEKEAQAIVSAAREGANARAIETTGRRTTGGTRRGD
jgi:V-type H+-transporting ATPase subunit G